MKIQVGQKWYRKSDGRECEIVELHLGTDPITRWTQNGGIMGNGTWDDAYFPDIFLDHFQRETGVVKDILSRYEA